MGAGIGREAVGLEEGPRLARRELVAKYSFPKAILRLAIKAAEIQRHAQA